MPIPEAASCGVHVMGMDTCAMIDVVRKCGGTTFNIRKEFWEKELGAVRSFADTDDAADKMYHFANRPMEMLRIDGIKSREEYMKHYSWDKTANILMDYLDNIQLKDKQGKWQLPPNIIQPPSEPQKNLSNSFFVHWLLESVVGKPHLINTYSHAVMLKQLNDGVVIQNGNNVVYTQEKLFEAVRGKRESMNQAEMVRCGLLEAQPEDYIEYANQTS
jgi:hypothetical protein